MEVIFSSFIEPVKFDNVLLDSYVRSNCITTDDLAAALIIQSEAMALGFYDGCTLDATEAGCPLKTGVVYPVFVDAYNAYIVDVQHGVFYCIAIADTSVAGINQAYGLKSQDGAIHLHDLGVKNMVIKVA